MSFGTWLVFGLMIAILLDSWVALTTCEYDACRFVSVEVGLLPFVNDVRFGQSGLSTLLMHLIYASDMKSIPPFLRAFLINATITAVTIPIIGWRNPVFQSPLALAFFVLPGKEFLLVIAVGFLARTGNFVRAKLRFKTAGMVMVALGVTFIARPAYVVLGGLALILGHLWNSKKRSQFWILASILFLVSGSNLFYKDTLADGGFEVEATIAGVNALRESTVGLSPFSISMRLIIYILYLIFLPIIEIYRVGFELSTNRLMPYHIFLIGASLEWLKWVAKGVDRRSLIGYAFISSFLVAISFPFVHTRYMLPLLIALFTLFPVRPINWRNLPANARLGRVNINRRCDLSGRKIRVWKSAHLSLRNSSTVASGAACPSVSATGTPATHA